MSTRNRDEVSNLLRLAKSLKQAIARTETRDFDQSMRLRSRLQAVSRRIQDNLAGKQPMPWPFDHNYHCQDGASGSYRGRGFSAMLGGPLCSLPEVMKDPRGVALAMLAEGPVGGLRGV